MTAMRDGDEVEVEVARTGKLPSQHQDASRPATDPIAMQDTAYWLGPTKQPLPMMLETGEPGEKVPTHISGNETQIFGMPMVGLFQNTVSLVTINRASTTLLNPMCLVLPIAFSDPN